MGLPVMDGIVLHVDHELTFIAGKTKLLKLSVHLREGVQLMHKLAVLCLHCGGCVKLKL